LIAIIGAGISGLALAHDLAARDVEHVVLEATDRPGGVIRSAVVEGHVLDWGPQRTRLVGAMRKLITEVGLLDSVILAPADLPLLVLRSGTLREVPRTFGALLRTDLISTAGKLRLLVEPLTGGARAEESVADYFTRKIGYELYANMVGPLYGGLYASDPADMVTGLSLIHALKEMRVERSLLMRALKSSGRMEIPAACSFREGMEALPRALHAMHADTVRLGTNVTGIEEANGRWVLRTSGATADSELRADHVVMTGNAAATAALLQDIDASSARAISSLRYNPLAIVHLHSADPVRRALGYQVGFDETLYSRGVTFNDSLFDRRGVYTAYLGGARNPEVVTWTDERLAETAVAEFKIATGANARALSVARTAMPAWDRSWAALAAVRAPAGIHFCTNWESRPGLPGRLARAAALAACLATSAPR
jgi:oxygen-dependent protoporphyrinogen oxidase